MHKNKYVSHSPCLEGEGGVLSKYQSLVKGYRLIVLNDLGPATPKQLIRFVQPSILGSCVHPLKYFCYIIKILNAENLFLKHCWRWKWRCCTVTEWRGLTDDEYLLDHIDFKGCALDKFLLNNLEYPTDLMAGTSYNIYNIITNNK